MSIEFKTTICRIAEEDRLESGNWIRGYGNGWTEYIKPDSFEKEEKDWDNDRWTETREKTKSRTQNILA